jgi:hypothetical protein
MQSFYGGHPQDWVKIPTWLFWMYAKMMPELMAQASIQRINEMSFATGKMDKRKSFTFIDKLQAQAAGLDPNDRRAYRPKSIEEMAGLLGSSTKIILET